MEIVKALSSPHRLVYDAVSLSDMTTSYGQVEEDNRHYRVTRPFNNVFHDIEELPRRFECYYRNKSYAPRIPALVSVPDVRHLGGKVDESGSRVLVFDGSMEIPVNIANAYYRILGYLSRVHIDWKSVVECTWNKNVVFYNEYGTDRSSFTILGFDEDSPIFDRQIDLPLQRLVFESP